MQNEHAWAIERKRAGAKYVRLDLFIIYFIFILLYLFISILFFTLFCLCPLSNWKFNYFKQDDQSTLSETLYRFEIYIYKSYKYISLFKIKYEC